MLSMRLHFLSLGFHALLINSGKIKEIADKSNTIKVLPYTSCFPLIVKKVTQPYSPCAYGINNAQTEASVELCESSKDTTTQSSMHTTLILVSSDA